MSFILGLDVGTASGAGATKRDGRVQPCALGDRTATLPSVVVLHDDGTTLVGEEAERIAGLELTRVARDVRLDAAQQTSPIVVGGQVHTPHELLRTLYSSIVERVCLSHNAAPSHLVLTHPAVPEGTRCETVERIADELFPGALVVPEPVAAAVKLACDGSLPPDCVVAVYDFGGGTFDVTLVRREGDRFSVVGDPAGLPKFGGIDVDDLVLDHVNRSLDGAVARLDMGDPDAMAALSRLRAECRDAKERLSYETEVAIEAALPDFPTLVRLTRAEFEEMLLPNLEMTVTVLERAIADAGLEPMDVASVALVGGSSRIPLVADLLGVRTNIPILVDPYPELTVALGAAQMVDDDSPNSSVFPIAELALPSLSALAGQGAVGLLSPTTGPGPGAQSGDTIGDLVGQHLSGGLNLGTGLKDPPDDSAFESLMQRGRDMGSSSSGRLVGAEVGAGPGTALGHAVGVSLAPRVGLAVLAGLVVSLFVGVLLFGGGGGDSDQAQTAGPTQNAAEDGPTSSASTSSSSTTSSSDTTSTTGDAVNPPLLDPTTTDDPGPATTAPPVTPGPTSPPPTSPTPNPRPTTTTTTTTAPPTTTTTEPPTTTTTTPAPTTSSSEPQASNLGPSMRSDPDFKG